MAIANRYPQAGVIVYSDHRVTSRHGPSPIAPKSPGWCRQWAISVNACDNASIESF
jgi:hypothetical protein